jgi:MFS family permease
MGAGAGFTANSNAVLNDAAPTQTGRASSQMELGNVLGIALGTGLGGLLIGAEGATPTYGVAGSLVLAAGAASIAFVVAGRFVGETQ